MKLRLALPLFLSLLSLSFQLSALEDPRQEYTVAVGRFIALGVPREHQYLAETLPRLILYTLDGLDTHRYPEEELAAYRSRIIAESAREAGIALAKAAGTESLSALNPAQSAADSARREADERYREEAGNQGSDLDLLPEKPVAIYRGQNDFIDVPEDALAFCRNSSVDLIISGRIEAIGELAYFSLRSFSYATGEWERIYSSATPLTSMEEGIAAARDVVRGLVTGSDWSSLSLATNVNESLIYLDEDLIGIGSVREMILYPGEYRLRIEAEGRRTVTQTIQLPVNAARELSFELEAIPQPSLAVSTFPAAADVYLSSRWVGETPLLLPPEGRLGTIRISKEGYRDLLLPAEELKHGKNSFSLEEQIYDEAARLKMKQDRLYNSVGLFTLALPLTMVSYSLYRDYGNQAALYGDDELADTSFLYNGLFYGSLYTAAILFVDMVQNLTEYRRAARDTF